MASESLASGGTAARRRSRLWRDLARDYQLHLIIALPVIWFIVFKYLPMYGAQIAFRDFAAAKGIWGSPWVGLDHFQKFFESYLFWRILGNTFFLSIYTLAATFPIPILLALSINNANSRAFRKAVQMIIYAPYFISTVVMVGLLIQFLSTSVGVVGPLMLALGMEPVAYKGRPEAFQSIYLWSHVWQFSGFGTIIYLAALAGIDPELHEAAIIDGATKVQRTRFIDIPGIMPTAVILFILTLRGQQLRGRQGEVHPGHEQRRRAARHDDGNEHHPRREAPVRLAGAAHPAERHHRRAWLLHQGRGQCGAQLPQGECQAATTEELREVLRAFKTQDPNGNGVADELPLSGFANSWHTRPGRSC